MTTTLTSPTRETTDTRETIEAARTPQDDLPANILASACPSRTVMRHLTDRWTPLIVAALSEQPVARFGELKAMIQGVSPKVLTQTLRSMERDGLVERRVTASIPPRVDYELTALGTTLIEPMTALRHWAQDNMQAVLESRERYDAAALESGDA
ncbi:helix-turn-helix domain-containing protein [Rothia sp. HMSC072B04]|uniref:winged helix-turn-helix transcriptional regulator n=1 Tax=Rothia sp. HMSC072B04 TaxID=1739432 RepID=UPI0009F4D884